MPPEYQPDEDRYAAVWTKVFTGPHRDHGGWWREQGRDVCACGEALPVPERAAA